MLSYIKFVYEGMAYCSILHESYLTDKYPGTNVIPTNAIAASSSIRSCYNKPVAFNRMPNVEIDSISKTGEYFNVVGKVEVNGIKYLVQLNSNELKAVEAESAVAEVSFEEGVEEVSPVEPESVAEEVVIEGETVAEEVVTETVEEDESVTSEIEEDLYEEITEVKEEVQTVSEPVTGPPVHRPSPRTSRNFVTFGALPATIPSPYSVSSTITPRKPAAVIPEPKPRVRGCSMNLDASMPDLGIHFGKDKPQRGVTFGPLKSSSVQPLARTVRAQKEAERAARRQIQEEANAAEAKRLQEAWNNTPANGFTYNVSAPVPVVFEPDVKEEVREDLPLETAEEKEQRVSREEAKAAVRAELPKEINDVIGDIPIELLGSIAECTFHPVNTVELGQKREMYCIDNRWCKQGKWFAVDVVPNVARYFYNSKLGVSIEIPINICKAWLAALSV